ncbi:MAG TPA: PHP domain-containing protein [Bacteroidota bacterium]|nr:PHP domain-containing protein [Bacteroidota bacterium]
MRTLAFHIHTSASYDCFASPATVLHYCRDHKIQSICVTDHDTIQGSIQVAKLAKEYGIQVIIGAEYHTEIGDIIGLFLQEEITSRKSIEVIRMIKGQGGISVLPHPFQSHTLNDEILNAVDVIEVFNSRCGSEQNARSLELARRLDKPMVAGADAHFTSDIMDCVISFSIDRELIPNDFLSTPRSWAAVSTNPLRMRLSQVTKSVKTNNPSLMVSSVRSFIYTTIHELVLPPRWKREMVRNEWKRGANA